MNVQPAIEAQLPFLRAEAESLMTDTCRITKPGAGAPTLDPVTLQYVDSAPTVVYEGICRISSRTGGITGGSTLASAGDAAWDVSEFPLSLPIKGSGDVAVGHTVTYLTSDFDPSLEGQVFGITAVPRQTLATARRFRMKQVVGGGS